MSFAIPFIVVYITKTRLFKYIDVGWESLSSRRENHKLILYYKMQNDLVPDYLSSLVPPTVGSTAVYNLRNDSDLRTISANS